MGRFQRDWSLRALLVLSLLIPGSVVGVLAYADRARTLDEAAARASRMTDVLHEHALRVMETNQLILSQASRLVAGLDRDEVREREGEIHADLADLKGDLAQVQRIRIMGADGRLAVDSERYPAPPEDLSRFAHVRTPPPPGRRSMVGDLILEPGEIVQSLRLGSRPAPHPRSPGAFEGLVAVSIQPAYFRAAWSGLDAEAGSTVRLFRTDGRVLVGSRSGISGRIGPELAAATDATPSGVVMMASDIHPDGEIVAYRRVGPFPLYVAYGMSRTEVTARWRQNWIGFAVLGTLASVALATVAVLAMGGARRERKANTALAQAIAQLRAEMARREAAEATVRMTQKLQALGELTGGVAHDFNNLLTAISGSLRLMAVHVTAKGRRHLETANQAVASATALTRQLLTFSRRDIPRVEVADANAVLEASRGMFARALRGRGDLEFDLAPEPCVLEVDTTQFELAVLNLVTNAADVLSCDGKVRISTCHVDLRDRWDGLHGRFVMVSVQDDGPGMPPEVAARAFEPFFTTKDAGHGTGLGLSMVYGFAQQAGGVAEIDSGPGLGTAVRLLIPASAKIPEPQPGGCPGPVAEDEPCDVRVLVVEDNVLVRIVTVDSLRTAGFDVLEAGSGAQALEVFERNPGISVLVSDVVMPGGISGLDLAREVRRRYPHVRTILTSGYTRDALIGMAPEDEVELMAKPYDPDALAERVRALLGERQIAMPL
ncbi:MAG TPA: ATP-binding protein [Azospirillaceae bacterium]|nr:ATP-binding protein [Azospirillaceae bacterium]